MKADLHEIWSELQARNGWVKSGRHDVHERIKIDCWVTRKICLPAISAALGCTG